VVRIAAFQKALDHPLFEQPLKAPAGTQFCRMPVRASIQRVCTRVARPVGPAAWRPVGIAARKPPRNLSERRGPASHEAGLDECRWRGRGATGPL
jgi:hypothetical protein